ncbi:hypothetical protein [Rummeliibacillus sp. SL167]|uniref:hypothetical protein n=1 Tax=Rummeliibacillus sp. SL167 TaxID=2579792 RepID=UPI0011B427B0|nr:hypothetical protein [Rummeliibacillus sp. SL167]
MKNYENWPLSSVSFDNYDIENDKTNSHSKFFEIIEKLKEQYKIDIEKRIPQHFSANKWMKVQALTKKEIESNGLPKEIFWKMVEFNVSARGGVSFERIAAISEHINYLASEYITYKARIDRDFEGKEKIVQLEKLHNILGRGFARLSNAYVDTVGTFFELNEIAGEKELMRQSIKGLYERKIQQYEQFISINPDYAYIKGTKDEWLERDSYFMGDILRLAVSKIYTQCIYVPEGLYTPLDLAAAGAFYQSAHKWLIYQKSTAISEEQLGIELGYLGMKLEVLLRKDGLSPNLKGKLLKVYQSFTTYKIEDINKRQEEAKHYPYTRQNKKYAKLDGAVVLDWASKMRSQTRKENIEAIFLEVIPAAFAAFQKKVEIGSPLERYQKQNDWNEFYEDAESITYPAGKPDVFHFNTMIEDWNLFIEKIIAQPSMIFTAKIVE